MRIFQVLTCLLFPLVTVAFGVVPLTAESTQSTRVNPLPAPTVLSSQVWSLQSTEGASFADLMRLDSTSSAESYSALLFTTPQGTRMTVTTRMYVALGTLHHVARVADEASGYSVEIADSITGLQMESLDDYSTAAVLEAQLAGRAATTVTTPSGAASAPAPTKPPPGEDDSLRPLLEQAAEKETIPASFMNGVRFLLRSVCAEFRREMGPDHCLAVKRIAVGLGEPIPESSKAVWKVAEHSYLTGPLPVDSAAAAFLGEFSSVQEKPGWVAAEE